MLNSKDDILLKPELVLITICKILDFYKSIKELVVLPTCGDFLVKDLFYNLEEFNTLLGLKCSLNFSLRSLVSKTKLVDAEISISDSAS